jgi:hypothetical protein
MNFKEWLLTEAAIDDLPYLDGMDFDVAVGQLEQMGFRLVRDVSGYKEFKHIDGSMIKVRPDGRIKRIGPRQDSDIPEKPGKFNPQYLATLGDNGKAILTRHPYFHGGAKAHGIEMSHDSGEKLIISPPADVAWTLY